MKSKRTAPSRRRISFAVDRDDIDVNSDWVEAVMALPAAATPSDGPITPKISPPPAENRSLPEENTAASEASGESFATVAENAPGVNNSTDASRVTMVTAADREIRGDSATVAENTLGLLRRIPRLRILSRITDGLTPGQFTVYRVMYEEGERRDDDHTRIYRGGYADLGRLTGMSKRGIQNVVGELQAKQVIRIHQKPGHHRSETSAYVVPDAARVLETWFSNGWHHAAGKSKMLAP